jgi:Arc/MetJ family transcription regulator
MHSSKSRTKKAAVDAALRRYMQLEEQAKIRDLWGTVEWEGDLEQSRLSRFADQSW